MLENAVIIEGTSKEKADFVLQYADHIRDLAYKYVYKARTSSTYPKYKERMYKALHNFRSAQKMYRLSYIFYTDAKDDQYAAERLLDTICDMDKEIDRIIDEIHE